MQKRMNWQAIRFDWNQVRAFLATIEEGSLSGAARVLGQTQPTLGRQVAALEEDLGLTLFERSGRKLIPTPAALEMADHVRAMGEAATRLSLAASGQSQSVEGTLRITASESPARRSNALSDHGGLAANRGFVRRRNRPGRQWFPGDDRSPGWAAG